tara:strand:+ start:72798 stop:73274 length:477 start_codon:yes stop_codon:yes gene_type:complete
MASVPNTTTFSLNDVRVVLGLGTTASLVDCIAAAVAASYNPLYYSAPATSLLEFRDYDTARGACNATTSLNFYPSSGQATSGAGTCPTGGSEIPYYFYPAVTNIASGSSTVTTDAGGCTPFNGGGLWYRVRSNGGEGSFFYSVRISASGACIGKVACT